MVRFAGEFAALVVGGALVEYGVPFRALAILAGAAWLACVTVAARAER